MNLVRSTSLSSHKFLVSVLFWVFLLSLFLREVVPQVMENESDVRCLQMIKLKKSGRYELFLPTNKQLPPTSRSAPLFISLSLLFLFLLLFFFHSLSSYLFSFFFTPSLLSLTLYPSFSLFNFSLTLSSSLRLLLHLQLFLLMFLSLPLDHFPPHS